MAQRPTTAQMRFDTYAEILALGSVRDGQKAYARDTKREYRYTSGVGWEPIPIKAEVDAKANISHTHVQADITDLHASMAGKDAVVIVRPNATSLLALNTNLQDGQRGFAKDTKREYIYTAATGWVEMANKADLDTKEPAIPAGTTDQVLQGDKSWTSKLSLPISNLVQAALNLKANLASLATVAFTGSYNDLLNKPTIPSVPVPAQAPASRSLNTAFQVSPTRPANVSYSVEIAASLSVAVGSKGTVILEIADNHNFTQNVQEVIRTSNGNTGLLGLGLNMTNAQGGVLAGHIPAGKWVRLCTLNNVNTPTFTYLSGQETLV